MVKNKFFYVIGMTFNKKGTRITDWSNFIEGEVGKLICYHPIVPFKHHKKVIEHVVKANSVHYGKGNYCLINANCEHCAWGMGLGINFSKQVEERPKEVKAGCATRFCGKCGSFTKINNSKTSLWLRNEINETNNKFDNLISSVNSDKVRDLEARIEIPTYISSDRCIVM